MIFLAQDVDSSEVFALKKMTCMDSETVKEAVREIELYNLFKHPNIIKCIDSMVTICPTDSSAKDVYMLLPLYKARLRLFSPPTKERWKMKKMKKILQNRRERCKTSST